MKKTGKIGSILCLLALLGLTGIYALPKVYVLYQANTGKVDICLKEYMLEEGKRSTLEKRKRCTARWFCIKDSTNPK